jgi:hypothetical protein
VLPLAATWPVTSVEPLRVLLAGLVEGTRASD